MYYGGLSNEIGSMQVNIYSNSNTSLTFVQVKMDPL